MQHPHIAGPALILTGGLLKSDNAKTAHGLLRGSQRFQALAVIDNVCHGQDAGALMDGKHRGVPVVESIAAYFAQPQAIQPRFCVVGVALPGGALPEHFRAALKSALEHGLSLVSGLHTFISDDDELATLARQKGLSLFDIRKPRPRQELQFWTGGIYEVEPPRVAVLGTDCAVGKRTTAKLLNEACQAVGLNTDMVYTGQTGWMQGFDHGFIFDSTVNDFVSGELEKAIMACAAAKKPDLIFIEGQSALRNPSGPAGAELIRSGAATGVILQHAAGRTYYKGWKEQGVRLPSLASEVALIEAYGVKVLGVTLNTMHVDLDTARQLRDTYAQELKLPVCLPLEDGVGSLVPVLQGLVK